MTRTNYYLKKLCGIYCITHTESGKQYCGQSVDCFERFKQHVTPKKGATGIGAAIMEWGVIAFSFTILEECSKESLDVRERWWIAQLGTLSPGGFNLTSGGRKGTVVSKETQPRVREGLRNGKIKKAARNTLASLTDHTQKLLDSLRHDSTWTTIDGDSAPPAGPPSVAPPTLEELEALLEKLKSCGV